MTYKYHRFPKYEHINTELDPSIIYDCATTYHEQVNLKVLIARMKSGDILQTIEPLTLMGTVGNRRYPAITMLMKLLRNLREKGILIDFTLASNLNDYEIWQELYHYQTFISNEARQVGTRRKLAKGQITGRPKITPDWERVKTLLRKGTSSKDIAKECRVSDTTVRSWIKGLKKEANENL